MLVASLFRLFKINGDTFDDAENVEIEPVALAILKAGENHQDVLESIFRSFSPNSWSGSRANVMEKRMQLFNREDLSNYPALRDFWLKQRALIAELITQDRQQELEWNKRESETFE